MRAEEAMDTAVSLVQADLRVNGYFTVSEYPVLEARREGDFRTVTDVDILAFRFPGAGSHPAGWPHGRAQAGGLVLPDPALGIVPGLADMLIGEVKEGQAVLNASATDPEVLRAALVRFGSCPPGDEVGEVVGLLMGDGRAQMPGGHQVRRMAFGSTAPADAARPYAVVGLGHVVEFPRRDLDEHWELVRNSETKDAALGFLLLGAKARRGGS